jgi:hypothetical protein
MKTDAKIGAMLSIIGIVACYLAAGPTLGLFIGGFFLATFLVPTAPIDAILIPIAAVWLLAIFNTSDTIGQWAELCLALFAYSLAISGLSKLLVRLKFSESLATAIPITIGLAWLTWPIWLSPQFGHLNSAFVNDLVNLHPPLVANGVLLSESPWPERTLAYHLTRLNQDIPMRMPTNTIACTLLHAAIGLFLLGLCRALATPSVGFARRPE